MSESLVARDVCLKIRNSQILNHVSFTLPRGQTLAVVGHNGAGKSTLFHAILGLKFRTSGELTLHGIDVQKSQARKTVGFVPERPYLNLELSFRKTLAYLGQLSGIPAAERARRIEELASEFELTRAIDQPLKNYSKGMLQRTLIAQAVLSRPDFLILDEPMSGLDPEGREFLKNQIHQWKKEGKTLLFSSHVIEDVRDLADLVLVLEGGQVTYFGKVSDWRRE